MRTTTLAAFAAALCAPTAVGIALPAGEQKIISSGADATDSSSPRKLHGRFLHITDFHLDPYYKPNTSTSTCHRGHGSSGPFGTVLSSCDSPVSLIDSTFAWLTTHIAPTVDFVIWTGDSARHDRDEQIPRTAAEVLSTNTHIASRFASVFSEAGIPVIPTLGNNDILPHNILLAGPNPWLRRYVEIWRPFIPESQRHQVARGGWFYTDVIPGRLAVVSLNTLYFFERNSGVDGCARRGEPGFAHMEWLAVQLEGMRERGVKAVLMGHVPPARTEGKVLWEESCWQAYTLWVERFRDVVVGAVYGHMNVDHFMMQDAWEVDEGAFVGGKKRGVGEGKSKGRGVWEEGFDARSAGEYLEELRDEFSKLPNPRDVFRGSDYAAGAAAAAVAGDKKKDRERKERKEKRRKKALKDMGGEWAERFQTTLVAPSVVPNYFPSLRVVEYNISGVDAAGAASAAAAGVMDAIASREEELVQMYPLRDDEVEGDEDDDDEEEQEEEPADANDKKKGKKKKKKKKGERKYDKSDLKIPPAPPASAPPGPAYSPQPLSWTGYTQYFANLSAIADKGGGGGGDGDDGGDAESNDKGEKGWEVEIEYEVEYSTFDDAEGFGLADLTVRSYLGLAHRIGLTAEGGVGGNGGEVEQEGGKGGGEKKKTKKKKKKKKKKGERERVWRVFLQRAFVGTGREEEIGILGDEEGEWKGGGEREEL